ncbi:class I adenylate-forming enzyme family protein [Sciscionella marina]|uniref:class I adenylate-forming enzyme family protein n=1 Tax=Sciscionella marina TaxID=508770 RepID=UPI000371AC60|nr:class I adenylate-forming enzyme family protein [Sciscionella marina]
MDGIHGLHPTTKVRRYLEAGYWTNETIDGVFREQVRTRGDSPAIVDPTNRPSLVGSTPRRMSWTELDTEVTRTAAWLLERGIGRGDVIGMQLPNGIELVQTYLAAWTIGAVVSPLAMQYREHEVVTMADKAGCTALVTCHRFGDRRPAAEALAVRERIPSLHHVVAFGDPTERPPDAPEGVLDLAPAAATEEDRQRVDAYRAAHPNDPNDCVTIAWTSGTESEPKGVLRAHYDWLCFAWATIEAPKVTTDDVLLNMFPMINMAGICGMLLPWLRTGSTLVQHHPFDPATLFDQLVQERVTYTLAPPTLLWRLLNDEELLGTVDLSNLTRLGSGSVPLQVPMVRGWQERFGIGVINFFGSNEGIGLLSNTDDFPDPQLRAQYFPNYGHTDREWSSRSSKWTRVRLVDVETGKEVTEPGHSGELRIAGPMLFAGYLDHESLPDAFDEDGFLKTGEIFEIAGENGEFLHYLDRTKDLIIRGGMNIAPAELESLILDHPSIAEVAVIGDPDETMGERVASIVVLHPGTQLSLDELVAWLRNKHIASFKLPERLDIRPALPRNPVGKLLKRELRIPTGG